MITQEAELEIHRLRREYPRLNATRIHEKLVEDGQKKALLNKLLDTMSRGEKSRAVYSSVCSVSGVNSAMSFREKPSPKIFNMHKKQNGVCAGDGISQNCRE